MMLLTPPLNSGASDAANTRRHLTTHPGHLGTASTSSPAPISLLHPCLCTNLFDSPMFVTAHVHSLCPTIFCSPPFKRSCYTFGTVAFRHPRYAPPPGLSKTFQSFFTTTRYVATFRMKTHQDGAGWPVKECQQVSTDAKGVQRQQDGGASKHGSEGMVLLQGAALGKAAAVTTGWGHKEAWGRGRYCRVQC